MEAGKKGDKITGGCFGVDDMIPLKMNTQVDVKMCGKGLMILFRTRKCY